MRVTGLLRSQDRFSPERFSGRTWQCGTIQLDFQFPELFDLTYIGKTVKTPAGNDSPVVFGSMERFIGILTEHYAGAFPVWLAQFKPGSSP